MKKIIFRFISFSIAFLSLFQSISQENFEMKRNYEGYYSKHSFFGYYDFVRQMGLGYTLSFSPHFDLTAQGGYVGPEAHATFTGLNDFYNKKGISLSFCPKFIVGTIKGFYVGPLISYQNLSYKNTWIEQFSGYDKYYATYTARSDLKSQGLTLQICIGTKHNYKHLYFETFVNVGKEFNVNHRTWYEVNTPFRFKYNTTYPYSFSENVNTIVGSAGLRIGFCKKYKKVKRKQFINNYVDASVTKPALGKLYRAKKISKEPIYELRDEKRMIFREGNRLYKKYFLEDQIMINKTNILIDSLNNYIKSNFPSPY